MIRCIARVESRPLLGRRNTSPGMPFRRPDITTLSHRAGEAVFLLALSPYRWATESAAGLLIAGRLFQPGVEACVRSAGAGLLKQPNLPPFVELRPRSAPAVRTRQARGQAWNPVRQNDPNPRRRTCSLCWRSAPTPGATRRLLASSLLGSCVHAGASFFHQGQPPQRAA